jgi:hypothetical protein
MVRTRTAFCDAASARRLSLRWPPRPARRPNARRAGRGAKTRGPCPARQPVACKQRAGTFIEVLGESEQSANRGRILHAPRAARGTEKARSQKTEPRFPSKRGRRAFRARDMLGGAVRLDNAREQNEQAFDIRVGKRAVIAAVTNGDAAKNKRFAQNAGLGAGAAQNGLRAKG